MPFDRLSLQIDAPPATLKNREFIFPSQAAARQAAFLVTERHPDFFSTRFAPPLWFIHQLIPEIFTYRDRPRRHSRPVRITDGRLTAHDPRLTALAAIFLAHQHGLPPNLARESFTHTRLARRQPGLLAPLLPEAGFDGSAFATLWPFGDLG
jgi:hypothetical protein